MGAQPAKLYGLAKVHKQGTPLRPVLSFDHLNETSAKYCDKIEGANIETNTQMARELLEETELDSDENMISLDVKSFNTNVSLKEAVEKAARRLYEQINPPEISCKTMRKLLNLAVSKVYFKFNGLWYVQRDGLARRASLAVNLASLLLREYEPALMKEAPKLTVLNENNNKVCPGCRTKGVECEACLNRFLVTVW